MQTIHASRPFKPPPAVCWAIGAVRVAGLLWEWRQRQHQHQQHHHEAAETTQQHTGDCEAVISVGNPFRPKIEALLARGQQLVDEVNTIPSEERQDVIGDELFRIATAIHELVAEEALFLKGKNS